ncbi:hypothetical protein GCM10029964_060250 [Kibdelosporangium lantanae]
MLFCHDGLLVGVVTAWCDPAAYVVLCGSAGPLPVGVVTVGVRVDTLRWTGVFVPSLVVNAYQWP